MIKNVVGLSSFGVNIQLKDLQHTSAPGVYYNPRRFSGTVIHLKKPRCCLLVFSTGKVVIAGGRSKDELVLAVKKLARMLRRIGYNKAKASDVIITNVVASSDLQQPLDINMMYSKVDFCHLDKERFPGASLDLPGGGKAIAFASGKYFVTGFKEEERAIEGLQEAKNIMITFLVLS